MKDKAIAYIRTVSPIVAGAIISYLLTLGLDLKEFTELFIITITGGLQVIYYIAARLIGKKYPKIEALMLGSAKQPEYKGVA